MKVADVVSLKTLGYVLVLVTGGVAVAIACDLYCRVRCRICRPIHDMKRRKA